MISKCFVESRTASARGTDSLAADITRHLNTRQYLGKAVVVCDDPQAMLSAMRKQWLKLSRYIQKERASTLNADKILKYTHAITHMQHMQFTLRTPLEHPDADVYILEPSRTALVPPQCWSVYIQAQTTGREVKGIITQLPAGALLIDYTHSKALAKLALLQSKASLEGNVRDEWRQAQKFLTTYNIDVNNFKKGRLQNVEAIDDALDILLGVSHKFLAVAYEFQRALELARPLRINKKLHEEYDSFILLAHRIQALTPGAFSQRFLETYNEDDTYFLLQDAAKHRSKLTKESLAQAVTRHTQAGRTRLALALLERFGGSK